MKIIIVILLIAVFGFIPFLIGATFLSKLILGLFAIVFFIFFFPILVGYFLIYNFEIFLSKDYINYVAKFKILTNTIFASNNSSETVQFIIFIFFTFKYLLAGSIVLWGGVFPVYKLEEYNNDDFILRGSLFFSFLLLTTLYSWYKNTKRRNTNKLLIKENNTIKNEAESTPTVIEPVDLGIYDQKLSPILFSESDQFDTIFNEITKVAFKVKFLIFPNIPEKKLKSALQSYAQDVRPEDVLMMFDSTIFGSGKEGILFTKTMIFAKDLARPGKSIKLSDVKSIYYQHSTFPPYIWINGEEFVHINISDKNSIEKLFLFVQEWADLQNLNSKNS